jgi:hypothetical protein
MRTHALAALLAAAAGCAGAGTTDAARCDRACERDEMCGDEVGSPYCDPECADRLAALRTEFRTSFLECHADSPCNDEPVDCEVEASSEVDQRQIDDNFLAECQPKSEECVDAFSVDFCFLTRYYEEAAVTAAMDCLPLGCSEVEACLRLELPLAPFD